MFKPKKKLNENAVKKDFFKVKKEIKESEKLYIKSDLKETIFLQTNELEEISLPIKNNIIFITTSKSRSLVNFIQNKEVEECYLFCSRLNQKSFDIIKNKNIKGIGLSERVLQNNPEFYNKVTSQVSVKLSTNHSKMLLFQIDENRYIVSGSGNASINSRSENYILENNEQKYNQIKKFFKNA